MIEASISKAIGFARTESEPKPQRAGYFSRLLAMLQHSRRLQAEHVLRQHAHLVERSGRPIDLAKPGDG